MKYKIYYQIWKLIRKIVDKEIKRVTFSKNLVAVRGGAV